MDRVRDAGARQVHDLEKKMADLRNQLDRERARAEEQVAMTPSLSSATENRIKNCVYGKQQT